MHLWLTKRSHLNSLYVHDDGQVLYRAETPFRFLSVGLVSTIKSALPGDIPAPGPSRVLSEPPPHSLINDNDVKDDVQYDTVPADDVDGEDTDYESKEDEAEPRVRFAHLAEIKFNEIMSSVIRYHGEEYETNKLFTKKEMGWYGRHRAFAGPDGLQYQWNLGIRVPELIRRDAARTPVARFHRRRVGVFRKARRASLEIFPEGMHMVDFILITFVYIQKIRNDAEGSSTVVEV